MRLATSAAASSNRPTTASRFAQVDCGEVMSGHIARGGQGLKFLNAV